MHAHCDSPLQLVCESLQALPAQQACPKPPQQVPPSQVDPAAQAFPHAPQLEGSLVESVQVPPHAVQHAPLTQESPSSQALPQAPQLAR